MSRRPDITAGLPADRDEWPIQVLAAVEPFVMGDIVEEPPLFYFADARHAVWAATKNYAEGATAPEIIDASSVGPSFGIITTQTCDIGEVGFPSPSKPWITVSPVYNMDHLDKGRRTEVDRGIAQIHWFRVPRLDQSENDFWVADLRLEVPIEKSWLVGRTPIKGFDTEDEQVQLSRRLAYIRDRPAWADVIVRNVQNTLVTELERLKKSDKALLANLMAQLDEIGACADSLLFPTTVRLGFFTRDADEDSVAWCQTIADMVRDACFADGLTVQEPRIVALDECTVAEYRTYDSVPLMRFSPI